MFSYIDDLVFDSSMTAILQVAYNLTQMCKVWYEEKKM